MHVTIPYISTSGEHYLYKGTPIHLKRKKNKPKETTLEAMLSYLSKFSSLREVAEN